MTSIQIYDTDADRLYEMSVNVDKSIAELIEQMLDEAEYLESLREREGIDE